MILKHRVSLGGVQLDSLDERILIQGIDEMSPKETISAVSLMGGQGQRTTGRHRDSVEVRVRFTLMIRKRDMAEREALLDQELANYAEPIPDARERIKQVLRVMLTAYVAARMRQEAEKMLDALSAPADGQENQEKEYSYGK